MCENTNKCEVVNGCVPVSCSEVANTPCANTCNSVTVDSNYVSELYGCMKDLEFKLQTAQRNCDRFQALYQTCLGAMYEALNKQDIKVLNGVTAKLAEIELKA